MVVKKFTDVEIEQNGFNINAPIIRGTGADNPYLGIGLNTGTTRRTGLFTSASSTTATGIMTSQTAIGTVTLANDTTEGRYAQLATTAAANANAGIRQTIAPFRREWGIYAIGRVSFSSTSDIRVFIGWSSDNNEIAGETTLNNFSGVGIGKRAGDTNWFTYRNDGDATEDRVDTTIAFATTAVTFELEFDGTSFRSRIGSTTNTAVTSELPAATTDMGFHCQIETGAGAADKNIKIFPIWARTGPQ